MDAPTRPCQWLRSVLAVTVVAASVGPAVVRAAELWEAELREQLEQQQSCELNFLTGVQQREIDGVEVTTARAHCMDKRSFDVRRAAGEYEFEIVACEPTYC